MVIVPYTRVTNMESSSIDPQIRSARNGHRDQAYKLWVGIQHKSSQLSIHHSQKNAGTVSRINRIFLFLEEKNVSAIE